MRHFPFKQAVSRLCGQCRGAGMLGRLGQKENSSDDQVSVEELDASICQQES
jgi:hypothetical protein